MCSCVCALDKCVDEVNDLKRQFETLRVENAYYQNVISALVEEQTTKMAEDIKRLSEEFKVVRKVTKFHFNQLLLNCYLIIKIII